MTKCIAFIQLVVFICYFPAFLLNTVLDWHRNGCVDC